MFYHLFLTAFLSAGKTTRLKDILDKKKLQLLSRLDLKDIKLAGKIVKCLGSKVDNLFS